MNNARISGHEHREPPRFLAGWTVVRVRGESMAPALLEGDFLLARRGPPDVGQLALVRLPGQRPLAVKRAVRREADGWWVERDNPRVGVDSWSVGAIADADVVAHVVRRIWPLRRTATS